MATKDPIRPRARKGVPQDTTSETALPHVPEVSELALFPSHPSLARDLLLNMVAVADSGLATLDLVRAICSSAEIGTETEEAFHRFITEASMVRTALELGDLSVDDVVARLPGLMDLIPITSQTGEDSGRRDPQVLYILPIKPRIPPEFYPPVPPPPSGLGPVDLTPGETNAIKRFLDILERAIAWLKERGITKWALQVLEDLLVLARQQLEARSPELFRTLVRLFSAVLRAVEAAGFVEGMEFLGAAFGVLIRLLGSRLFHLLGVIGLLIFVAQTAYAVGEKIAAIKINKQETVGTWWGNRFWDLVKGPCPQLLEALNLAILAWRQLQASGAPAAQQADALARVIVLESEYVRRCLTSGSGERTREERYLALLQAEYSDLVTTGVSPFPAPAHRPPPRPGVDSCNVTITLLRIDYGGNDIGSDWKFVVGAGTNSTDVPVNMLANGTSVTLNPPLVVYQGGFSPCSSFGLIPLTVEGHQLHLLGDDVGTNSRLLRPTCPTDRDEPLAAWVNHESTFWQRTDSALLSFTFHVQAACGAAVVP